MATAYSMTTRASGPSLPIIEKQQGLWDEQQIGLRSIVTIYIRNHPVHNTQHPRCPVRSTYRTAISSPALRLVQGLAPRAVHGGAIDAAVPQAAATMGPSARLTKKFDRASRNALVAMVSAASRLRAEYTRIAGHDWAPQFRAK